MLPSRKNPVLHVYTAAVPKSNGAEMSGLYMIIPFSIELRAMQVMADGKKNNHINELYRI